MSHPLLPKNLNRDNALFRQGVPDFSKLNADAFPVPTEPEDQGAILEVTDTGDRYRWTGSVWVQVVTGGRAHIDTGLQKTAFGELSVSEPTPITQISAPYGLLEKTQVFALLGGTGIAANSMFEATSGTDPNALSAVLSRRQVTYRPGQGLLGMFTALFDTPQADSSQQAGLIINTERLGFGYEGTSFGIIYEHSGESEIRELTITTPAAGSESATITVDGTGFTVPLTAGTVQHNAFEISQSLNAQIASYAFSSNNDQIVARSLLPVPGGSFAFSSGTAVASWSQVIAGLANTSDFIAQADWNVDTRISSDTDINLDPAKGNVYKVQMQYLGFGGIEFYVEDKQSAELTLVHRIQFANTSTQTSVGNPTFRVGWLVQNDGNTTSITVKGGSAAGFIEGAAVRTEAPRAQENTAASVPTANAINVLTIRNRLVFGTRRNRAETFGLSLTAATDTTKAAIIEVRSNAAIVGDLDFSYIDKVNSTTEVATDGGAVSNGRLIASFIVPASGGIVANLEELLSLFLPGEMLTVSARITSGSASSVSASLTWQEDL